MTSPWPDLNPANPDSDSSLAAMPGHNDQVIEGCAVPTKDEHRLQRVLYAMAMNPSLKFGSREQQLCELAAEFRRRGSLFIPLYISDERLSPAVEYEATGIRALCVDLRAFRLRQLIRLVRIIRENRIDVVNWNFTSPLGNPYLWMLSILTPRVRHYFSDHNSRESPINAGPSRLLRLSKGVLLRRYRKVICVSDFVLECLRAQGCWSHLRRCLQFVDVNRFKPDVRMRTSIRQRMKADDRFVVVTIANLIEEKGVDILLRAMAGLPESVVCWVIGDGPAAEDLQSLATELNLGEKVRFLGRERRVESYLQAADCLVCPSLWAEAAGLVNLEAQACGLPVVASDIGGIPEFVSDGVTGFLFSPGDPLALAELIRRLYENPILRRELGEAARKRMVEHFSVERGVASYLELYSSA